MANKKDKIIKIVLIIVIILLLVHNCTLIKKKGEGKTPSGNINIIEITCENNNKCDEKDDGKKNTTIDDKKDDNDNKTDSGSKVSDGSSNNNVDNNSNNGKTDNGGTNNNGTADNSSDDDTTETGDDDSNQVKVFDSDVVWKDTTELKIFENSMYNLEGVIAPESSNTYEFIVKNSTSYNLKYNISFVETNPYHINMKYKLKKNDTYIVDHYVSYDELNINEQLLNAKANDTFYLEWKWVSSDHDNEAGTNNASYNLKIDVRAESV